jgi:hypothetical protein
MVKIVFARGAKTIEVLEDIFSKEKAQDIADQNKGKAFGTLAGIRRVFSKHKPNIMPAGYHKRYDPFWHIVCESVQEYKRRTTYGFTVKPEVRSVTFNNRVIPVDEREPICRFDGIDHCFEQYSKEVVQGAIREKEHVQEHYLGCKRRAIRSLDTVQGRDVVVSPINIRASYLVNHTIKELIKPIQADEIIREIVEIKRLSLLLRPVHVFAFSEEGSNEVHTIEVDAITGSWARGDKMFTSETGKRILSEGVFEVGSEIAAMVIPGAAAAAVLGRHITHMQKHKKDVRRMKELRSAYEKQKRRK